MNRRLVGLVGAAAVVASALSFGVVGPAAAATDPCGPGSNPVVCENSKPGDDGWQVGGAGYDSIQGFATDISVNVGSTVKFKIKAQAAYTVTIYRLGWYGGLGARRQAPP